MMKSVAKAACVPKFHDQLQAVPRILLGRQLTAARHRYHGSQLLQLAACHAKSTLPCLTSTNIALSHPMPRRSLLNDYRSLSANAGEGQECPGTEIRPS